jgi:hypothetical protein
MILILWAKVLIKGVRNQADSQDHGNGQSVSLFLPLLLNSENFENICLYLCFFSSQQCPFQKRYIFFLPNSVHLEICTFKHFLGTCKHLYRRRRWLVGWFVHWSLGPSVRRSVGPSVRRSVGPSVRRSVGPSVRRSPYHFE